MKTVLTEFLEELKEHGFYPSELKIKELLEKEKQQIIEAYENGQNMMEGGHYYNETFS